MCLLTVVPSRGFVLLSTVSFKRSSYCVGVTVAQQMFLRMKLAWTSASLPTTLTKVIHGFSSFLTFETPFFMARYPLVGTPHYWRFTIILRHTTLGTTSLDEWLARRGDLYLTTNNTYKRHTHTSMPPARFEPAFPASERSQTQALDRAAAGIGFRPLTH